MSDAARPAPAGRPAKFLTGNLLGHITVMSLTASVGLMAVFAVDFINMIFISMLGRAELAAAIGYASAILFFTTSFGIGMGIAGGALVARAVGEGDRASAQRRATNSLIYGAAFGAVFAAVVWVFLRPLSALLGATGQTLDLTVHYLAIVIPSLPFLMIGMVGGAILRSHGDARRSMWATVGGALVNAALDPILIFGFGWDLTGAAIATFASRIAIGVIALIPIIRFYGGFGRPDAASIRRDLMPVLAIATPAILTQLATPVGQAYVTRAMSDFGEDAVAGLAIVSRMTPVAFGIIFAMSGAVGPIIGQNAGAGRYDRVRQTIRDGMIFTALVTLVVTAILWALRPAVTLLFGLSGVTQEIVFLFTGPLALLFFFNGAVFVGNAACNNLNAALWSTLVNWGRHTLGTVPFVLVAVSLWGASGVLIGQALGGVVFGLIAWGLAELVARREGRLKQT